ncbi:MAG: flavodoxin-dependent (E)-4-hydroxy-3-methylbut-2-enyl-diphosphate synthase [candidate division WOR-3 bacterium]|nr:flavodoxin-dependent (E)-4-hydroxy-3-methylbut-2-enyl-diphosphate synthase [candidate division WOR-3 bacterium]MCX7947191.1 flavodoxin-dependent (E)-4-hydroxy-3-methylbut-2-enyl-diphosphate synthase [candidate division WOR-3 bacterium]MDW8150247.1 flavodoxin-dependent (E)-4-hydroxy-3-methylbut-2-enyl-diphosphate synthase [candidate division WOR-3 bacterium]
MYTPIKRKKTREVKIGNIGVGGNNPIRVQSMTSTKTEDVEATVKQILELKEAGCEIVRVAVPSRKHVESIKKIVEQINNVIPIVADVHFDYKIAIMVSEVGVSKVRINPGNIGGFQKVREVISACKLNGIPIRIGVNSGSLEKDLIDKYNGVTADALVESAIRWIDFFDKEGFLDIVISVKSSIVPQMIEAYRKLSEKVDFPLHLGVTEAGTPKTGIIKSAIGIGSLLYDGIGDTFRVSLTAEPVEEVKVAWEILKALGIRSRGVDIIACPTCGRTKIDLISLAEKVEKALENEKLPIKVAVMGCEVNGPGEASIADVGIAAGKNQGVIFRKGVPIKRLKEEELLNGLLEEIEKIKEEMGYK